MSELEPKLSLKYNSLIWFNHPQILQGDKKVQNVDSIFDLSPPWVVDI